MCLSGWECWGGYDPGELSVHVCVCVCVCRMVEIHVYLPST